MLNFIFMLIFGWGLFLVACDILNIPLYKTSRAFVSLYKRQIKKTNRITLMLNDFSDFIAKFIHMNEYKKLALANDLRTAGMKISPEKHLADSIVKGLICAAISVPILLVFPLLFPVMLMLSFAIYLRSYKSISAKIEKRRNVIEFELPRFVFYIEKHLMHSRDVLGILDSYRQNAGEDMKSELDITVADMRSSNYEAALTRFEGRLSSAMLSKVVRGLISVLNGNKTSAYWQTLSLEFADIGRQQLKREAKKVPKRVKKLSMCLLFCFMAIFFIVIVSEVLSGVGAMFG